MLELGIQSKTDYQKATFDCLPKIQLDNSSYLLEEASGCGLATCRRKQVGVAKGTN